MAPVEPIVSAGRSPVNPRLAWDGRPGRPQRLGRGEVIWNGEVAWTGDDIYVCGPELLRKHACIEMMIDTVYVVSMHVFNADLKTKRLSATQSARSPADGEYMHM